MAYEFSGLFVKICETQDLDPQIIENLELRFINEPFQGVAIRFRNKSRPKTLLEEVLNIVGELGIRRKSWLYIEYCTWAGRLDSIRGFVSAKGELSKIYDDDNLDTVEQSYLGLMASFGLIERQALHFQPFTREFWLDCPPS